MRFRYYIGTETDPYRNLATEQELLKTVSKGIAILYLWQNDNTIVIGRNQNPYNECKVEDFLNDGGKIARRKSGGGAVFHDLGNLNYSILSDISERNEVLYHNILINALKSLDILAEYNGRNDIIINGKKCSGNAVYQDGFILCQHGTVLVNTDIERMVSYLTPNKSKLDRNHISSVFSRVINVSELVDGIGVKEMIRAIIEGTEASPLVTKPERHNIDLLEAFYSDYQWVFGGKR